MTAATADVDAAVPTNKATMDKGFKGPRAGSRGGPKGGDAAQAGARAPGTRPPGAKPDPVFEAKRTAFMTKLQQEDEAIQHCRHRISAIFEQLEGLRSGDKNAVEKNNLRQQMTLLKDRKNKLIEEKKAILAGADEAREQLKKRGEELKDAKDKLPFKKPEDITRKIKELEASIESGQNKLIDEKKMVAEVSKLNKAKRQLESLDGGHLEQERLRKTCDEARELVKVKDAEIDALSAEQAVLKKRLSAFDAIRDSTESKAQVLLKERDKLRAEIDGHIKAKNEARKVYDAAKEAHALWVEKEKLEREEQRQRREVEYAIKDLEYELKRVDEPAAAEQITQATNIQQYLRTNVLKEVIAAPASAAKTGSSTETRAVEGLHKGEVVFKTKAQRDAEGASFYYAPTKGGKKKGATGAAADAAAPAAKESDEVKLPFWVLSGLAELNLGTPATVADVQGLVHGRLEQVKQNLVSQQEAAAKTVDSKRAAITEKIEAEKAKLAAITPEKIKSDLKARQVAYAAKQKAEEAKAAAAAAEAPKTESA